MNETSRAARLPPAAQWTLLIALTAVFAVPLELIHLPAGVLVGAIAGAILGRVAGLEVKVHPRARSVCEAMLGTLLAGAITKSALSTFWDHAILFLSIGVTVLLASAALSWLLLRLRLFPGTTAVWGLTPGAANVMMILSGSYGADERLVAFMQYLRVVMVAGTAPVVAHLWGQPTTGAAAAVAAGHAWPAVSVSIALAAAGLGLAMALPFAGGTLLIPLALGGIAQLTGVLRIDLPGSLMFVCYVGLGWSVGLAFTLSVLRHAIATLPQILAAIVVLIGFCAGIGALISRIDGIEPLTAYLATSPGGLSSIGVIAATTRVDLPFVISMQTLRFMMVLACGPMISRFLARRAQSRA